MNSAALFWLAAFACALWPTGLWAAARMVDGSDDPLGLAAIAVLLVAVVRLAPSLQREPSRRWLAVAAFLAVASATVAATGPALLGALIAALALAAALRAFMAPGTPALPLAGLAVLALPVVSSMQFYAGFPLRVVTAEASAWLLGAAGFSASREGSAMTVDGRLVVVDAPCSGVQMVWMAYFCACTVAWWARLPDRVFARRVAGVGVIVLAGNVVRNAMLVGLEARAAVVPGWLHEAIGAAVLAAVCVAVSILVGRAALAAPATGARTGPKRAGSAWRRPLAALLATCAALPLLAAGHGIDRPDASSAVMTELPRELDGRPLRPLALGTVEARFAAHFPGRIARLTDERSVVVWRDVTAPTRMLHPAADCYRGLGYRIAEARLERDAEGRLWRTFVARRDGRRIRVAEPIVGRDATAFTDASAWFWAAQLGRSHGPWQAITVATPLENPA
ncbi:MAG: exosortase Q [Caldimonas sp.]